MSEQEKKQEQATVGIGALVYYTRVVGGRIRVDAGYITRVLQEEHGDLVDLRLWPSGELLERVQRCWQSGWDGATGRWSLLPPVRTRKV